MDKKLFVFLFPQREYMKNEFIDVTPFRDEVIRKRYLNKDYEFAIARFKGSRVYGVTVVPDKVVDADITFEESTPYYSKHWKYADFGHIADSLSPERYRNIAVGGFHCFDCVKSLAVNLYNRNPSTIIDTDLTEFFENRCLRFDIQKGQKLRELKYEFKPHFDVENYDAKKSLDWAIYDKKSLFLKEVSHPVFGL